MKQVVLVLTGFWLLSWITLQYFTGDEDATTVEKIADGNRLYLTPLIERGDLKMARRYASVRAPFDRKFVQSYSGFITVNATCNANLFFWFFLSKANPSADPVLLLLEGGPGDSTTARVFDGAGPFTILEDTLFLQDNPHSLNDAHNVLFVDSPVGTGFSFTDCVTDTLQQVGEALHELLRQFYVLFHEYKPNPLFLSGVNYSVKDVLHLASLIREGSATNCSDINLQGLLLGSPLVDPAAQLDRSQFLYQLGLVDRNDRDFLAAETARVRAQRGDADPHEFDKHLQLVSEMTGGVSSLNYLQDADHLAPPQNYLHLLGLPRVRRALHVGDADFAHRNASVRTALKWTLMQSARPLLASVLERYRVLLYAGQLDATTPYPGLATFLHHLAWSGVDGYRKASRYTVSFQDEVGYFVKGYGRLCECMLRKAGHCVYTDNPGLLQQLVYAFTRQNFTL